MSQERSAEVMRLYLEEAVGKGNFAVIETFAAEDMIDHSQPDKRGPAALLAHVTGFRENFPDVEVDVQRIIASDDEVAGVWRLKGTQTKPLFGLPATGRELEFTVVSLFKLRDGMLVDYRVVADALEAAAQMGVKIELPATEEASPV